MFANPKFSKKNMPVFVDQMVFDDGETDPVTCLKAYVFNDGDNPPKTLVALDMFRVPREDMKKPDWEQTCYDLESCMALLPEDAIMFIRALNTCIAEIFNDENYLLEGITQQARLVKERIELYEEVKKLKEEREKEKKASAELKKLMRKTGKKKAGKAKVKSRSKKQK